MPCKCLHIHADDASGALAIANGRRMYDCIIYYQCYECIAQGYHMHPTHTDTTM